LTNIIWYFSNIFAYREVALPVDCLLRYFSELIFVTQLHFVAHPGLAAKWNFCQQTAAWAGQTRYSWKTKIRAMLHFIPAFSRLDPV